MVKISDKEFGKILSESINDIPPLYKKHLKNVAFLVEEEPTPQQRQQLHLRCNDLLFGLYEGVPLPRRGGATKLLPDKITVFKGPIELTSENLAEIRKKVRHTVWHEVAHYYGLGHKRIHELENNQS
jgi:predicted Zn-dependent protease with MMP-like domain